MFVDDRVRDIDQIRAICLYNIEFVIELVYLDDTVGDITS